MKDEVDSDSIRYKYNKKKVSLFVFCKGKGTVAKGEQYIVEFPGLFRNVCVHQVVQSPVISRSLKYSHEVNLLKQNNQYGLALEKK